MANAKNSNVYPMLQYKILLGDRRPSVPRLSQKSKFIPDRGTKFSSSSRPDCRGAPRGCPVVTGLSAGHSGKGRHETCPYEDDESWHDLCAFENFETVSPWQHILLISLIILKMCRHGGTAPTSISILQSDIHFGNCQRALSPVARPNAKLGNEPR
ncbi:hypothetical protein Desti_0099 [Desulfomonile tiedjei DSM 6799]|uniref:Uncharacterized protein n=1 Tax=Desulfomonile tiedjei (strain ATCC 49306 / DSM 6799 / DCB-1) TaxID=706587 RepID=I4BZV7_DESTA|nr:hypothetical protein Desti_0099 [Desulfomonile tiedjei DSM 6799]